MQNTVNAVLVADHGRWFRTIPPEAAFDVSAARRAIETAVAEVGSELRASRRTASARARRAFQDLAGMSARLDQLARAGVDLVPFQTARETRREIVRAGNLLYSELATRNGTGSVLATVRQTDPFGDIVGAALLTGGFWLLDRWLDRRGGRGRRR